MPHLFRLANLTSVHTQSLKRQEYKITLHAVSSGASNPAFKTDGHVDFYARFSEKDHIIYTLDNDKNSPDYHTTAINKNMLQNVTNVLGNKLTPVALLTPDSSVVRAAVTKRNGWPCDGSKFDDDTFAASYIGYYVSDKFLLMAQYGDPAADLAAFNILKNIFPDKLIMQISTDGISSGGGTIH
ncbi:unnamed protein product [Absidia cylindrospora]